MKLNEASATYEGETTNDGVKHGKGKLIYIDGTCYEGNFTNGKREGYGQQRYKDGSVYTGEWKNDMRSGEGEIRFTDTTIVRTTFKDDMKHGKGSMTDPSGKIHECIYYMDCEIRLGDQNPDCWGLAPLNFVLSLIVLILVYVYFITP